MPPIVALYVLWMLWFLSWMAAALSSSRSDRKLSTAQNIVYSIAVIIAGLLLFGVTPAPGWDVQYRLWPSPKEALGWLAVGGAFIAFCIAWWATICRALRRNGPVIGRGPYKFARHPIYASLMVASVATAAVFGRPSSFTGAALLVLAFVARIVIEEHTLRDESADYDDYAERVPMLLPLPIRREAPLRHAEVVVAPPVFPAPTRLETAPPAILVQLASEPDLPDEPLPVAEPDAPPPVIVEDEKLDSELVLAPAPLTAKAVQLDLALDGGAARDQAADRGSPRGPSTSELKPTSAA